MDMKKEITKEEYLQLKGLQALRDKYNEYGNALEKTFADLVGEEVSKYGHYDWAGDFIYSTTTIEEWLAGREIILVEQLEYNE
jgi:hypothetical protein